jgi:CHAT domain-containing protein/Tfp pilus assembly protein PilF
MRPPTLIRTMSALVGALALAALARGPARAEPEPARKEPPLTAEQQARLKEADQLDKQADKLRDEGKLSEAAQAAEKRLALVKEVRGAAHEAVAEGLEKLADLCLEGEDFDRARAASREALGLRVRLHGEGHYQAADAQRQLADVDLVAGFSAEDRARWREARSLNAQVERLYGQGKWREALPLARRVVEVRRELLGDHPDTADALANLGVLLKVQGDPAAARPYLEQALAVFSKTLLPGHPQIATALNNLAMQQHAQGDYAAARPYLERALALRQKALPQGDPAIGQSLSNLGVLLQHQGDYAAARRYYEQALELRRKALRPGHPDIAISLNNLGLLLQAQGDHAAVRPYLEQALALRQKALPPGHPYVATSLNNLGLLLKAQGDYAAARPYLEQALALLKEALPAGHPHTAISLNNLGLLLQAQGDYAAARPYLEQALAVQMRLAERALGTLSEAEALAFVEPSGRYRDNLLSAFRHLDDSSSEEAYAAVWDSRGLAGRAVARQRNLAGDVPEAQPVWEQLRDTRDQLAKLTLAAVTPDKAQARREQLARLTADKERLERELAVLSTPFRRMRQIQSAGFADLASRLPPGAAVLDVVEVKVLGPADMVGTRHYEAFVLRRAGGARGYDLSWVHLGPAAPIDEAVRAWRAALADDDPAARGLGRPAPLSAAAARPATTAEPPERVLRRRVWEPVEAHLRGCSSVLIIPDGALTAVPWAALPGRRPGRYLLEEYALGAAAYGQQLYDLLTREPPQGGGLLAVGGVRYDDAPPEAGGAPPGSAHRGPALDPAHRPRWGHLPASAEEARQVAGRWGQSGQTTLLEGPAAAEAAVRAALPRARYAHLATHGFFADARFRSAFGHDTEGERLAAGGGRRATVTGRNPLILSGVVLAGANTPQPTDEWGAPVGDDGLLTAEEVAELDLSGTQLVVLSAWETGLGEVAGGEGVLGLQRAFHQAGARGVVASLWQVDDRASQRLMADFYDGVWGRGLGPLEALRQAQLNLLRGPGGGAQAHPRLWAAWVLSGDPGPLPPPAPAVIAAAGPAEAWAPAVLLAGGGVVGVLLLLSALARRPRRYQHSPRGSPVG